MWSSNGKPVFLVVIAMAISEAAARRPSAIKQWDYIGPDDYSFVARISLNGTGETITCAGAIISPRHVLTAGSCVRDKTGGAVYTGIQHGSNDSAIVSGIRRFLLRNFTMRTESQDIQNDIGIVTLSEDLVFGLRQRNIDLPTEQPAENLSAWFAGWEPTSDEGDVQLTFKKTRITLRSGEQCSNGGTDDAKARKLCSHERDVNFCPGESGSPVLSDGVLYGIASADPCSAGSDGRYTNVFHHVNWIKDVIEL